MTKETIILLLLLCLAIYLSQYCWERLFYLSSYPKKLEKFKEQSKYDYIPKEVKYLITDLTLEDVNYVCPHGYQFLLPYLSCKDVEQGSSPQNQEINIPIDQNQSNHCYSSSSDKLSLFFVQNLVPREQWPQLKICAKKIYPPDFRYKQILFDLVESMQSECYYWDTNKRGYMRSRYQCAKRSYEQGCEDGKIRYESDFLIICLDNEDQVRDLNEFKTCNKGEIVCSSSQTFYCVKQTESCPISDIQVYQNKPLHTSVSTTDIRKARIDGLEINDRLQYGFNALYEIEVRQGNDGTNSNLKLETESRQWINLQNEKQSRLLSEYYSERTAAEKIEGEQTFYQQQKLVEVVKDALKRTNQFKIDLEKWISQVGSMVTSYYVYYILFFMSEVIGLTLVFLQLFNKGDNYQVKQLIKIKGNLGIIIITVNIMIYGFFVTGANYKEKEFLEYYDQQAYELIHVWCFPDYILFLQNITFIITYLITTLYEQLK